MISGIDRGNLIEPFLGLIVKPQYVVVDPVTDNHLLSGYKKMASHKNGVPGLSPGRLPKVCGAATAWAPVAIARGD